MKVILKIERFDANKNQSPYFQEYSVEAKKSDRIIDLLVVLKRNHDGSLAFRKSCAHGICGSDAMRINGMESLACKVLVQDVAKKKNDTITLQPLKNLPVEKDLMVNQKEFFKRYLSVKPFLISEKQKPEKEWIQNPEERDLFDEAISCILCESCYSACPVLQKINPNFLGPAQVVQAQRFNEDSRDEGFRVRLNILDNSNGVWSCENFFQCPKVCPRGIKITKLINISK